ncbi:MAG: hypothetical protein WAW84_00020 [Candidatus Rickettsiella isopodorum]|jgi:hypothetical protein
MLNKRQPIFDLDDEEQELSDSFDRGGWKSTKKLKQEINDEYVNLLQVLVLDCFRFY